VHFIGFIIRIYHDARSSECQIRNRNNQIVHDAVSCQNTPLNIFPSCSQTFPAAQNKASLPL